MQTPVFTWPPEASLEALNARSRGTLMEALGIVFTELGDGYLRATMPVTPQTRQPYGLLHGGASVALAETLGSSAGMLMAGGNAVVGLEINANHLRAVRSGTVTGTARPFHLGRSTQVWEIQIEDEGGQAVCISRITLAVLPAPPR
ncbi:hotdog fold thioesterase [Thermomonas sp. S9]|uniref:hotdog fold thioesterase n=1 Tax=Thermomonas sp. S9 TaxID=2885203 RepID=UPI00216B668A|nr:hotdog fold thioesterase [Thermomonas sp. S9]MCR6495121.1 hotdog fold thioesterase [Thermomonas sp. S9]